MVYPSKRCPKCNDPGKDFARATMGQAAGRKANGLGKDALAGISQLAAKENLMPRGVEQPFSLKQH